MAGRIDWSTASMRARADMRTTLREVREFVKNLPAPRGPGQPGSPAPPCHFYCVARRSDARFRKEFGEKRPPTAPSRRRADTASPADRQSKTDESRAEPPPVRR